MSLFFAWKYCTVPINGNFIVMYFGQTVNVRSFGFCFRFWHEIRLPEYMYRQKTGMQDGAGCGKKVVVSVGEEYADCWLAFPERRKPAVIWQ